MSLFKILLPMLKDRLKELIVLSFSMAGCLAIAFIALQRERQKSYEACKCVSLRKPLDSIYDAAIVGSLL